MNNELNPRSNVFGKNLGFYIKVNDSNHKQNIDDFKKLCKEILSTIAKFKGIKNNTFERAEFRLEKPFSDIIIMISLDYIRFDFEKKDNRICYFTTKKYDDYLSDDTWWILRVLLDNREDLKKAIFYKTKRSISYSNVRFNDLFLDNMKVLFSSNTFIPLVNDFLPRLGNILFNPTQYGMIRYCKDFTIGDTSKIFSKKIESDYIFKIIKDSKKYKFELSYDNFIVKGFTSITCCSNSYEFFIYENYHGCENEVLLYSYKYGEKPFLNTKEGPQDYRLSAILPLVELYNVLAKEI